MGLLDRLFGRNSTDTTDRHNVYIAGSAVPQVSFNLIEKNDAKKLRDLFYNRKQEYALSAQLIKPIINSTVYFVAQPTISSGNKKTKNFIEALETPYELVHKMSEREGSVFVWPQWDAEQEKILFVIIPAETVTKVFRDPLTKKVYGYQLEEHVIYDDVKSETQLSMQIKIKITDREFIRETVGSEGTRREVLPNPFGFLPIIHFSANKEVYENLGHSEIENIEPQLKFYHELTYEAGAAQKRDGHPKTKVQTPNVRQWIDNNFGAGAFDRLRGGEGTVSLDDRDLYINKDDEDVNYLYLQKTSGDYNILSERAFTNIVEGSETPEVIFGANLGTSLASVKENRPVWIKKILSKQACYSKSWEEVFKMAIFIYNFVTFRNIKDDFTLIWPVPDFKSEKENAEILSLVSNALDRLLSKGMISKKEVYEVLKKLPFIAVAETYEKHEEDIENEKEANTESAPVTNENNESSQGNAGDDVQTKSSQGRILKAVYGS